MRSEKEIRAKLKEVEGWSFWKKFKVGFPETRKIKDVLKWVLSGEAKLLRHRKILKIF